MFVGQFWTILDFGRSGTSPGSNATPAVIEKFRNKKESKWMPLSLQQKFWISDDDFLKKNFLKMFIFAFLHHFIDGSKGKQEGKGRERKEGKAKKIRKERAKRVPSLFFSV